MRIVSIEPTPNPNSMKLNLDACLPMGVSLSYSRENEGGAPAHIRRLLTVDGVKSVYHTASFIALERHPRADWQTVLTRARQVLEVGDTEPGPMAVAGPAPSSLGEVRVLVQMFRGLPLQVKLLAGTREVRLALPDRFREAAMAAAAAAPDFIGERQWADRGVRYGDIEAVGAEVTEQIAAAFDDQRLARLVARALAASPALAAADNLPPDQVAGQLDAADWQVRYAALDRLDPVPAALPVVLKALSDASSTLRRLAVVYMGEIGGQQVLSYLFRALTDPAVAVRRAAGDCLSDLGEPAAIGPMTQALRDPSKLVRWRAARFLYEVGDATALAALRAAQDDPEFEVALQVKMAIERISGGQPASGPAWKQMTR